MTTLAVVVADVTLYTVLRCLEVGVGVEIDLFVLEAAPKALNEDVVNPPALAIHTDTDATLLEHVGKGFSSELCALVGIEDVWITVGLERLF